VRGLIVALLVGCSTPCERLCDARAAAFEPCLGTWQVQWDEFLAQDAKDYAAECRAAMRVEEAAASDPELLILHETCEGYVVAHEQAAGDCDQQWALFEEATQTLP
jgi:hypothetical protein